MAGYLFGLRVMPGHPQLCIPTHLTADIRLAAEHGLKDAQIKALAWNTPSSLLFYHSYFATEIDAQLKESVCGHESQ